MDDKIFRVDIERSRVYWDYYKSMFIAFSMILCAGMVSMAVIYTKGELNLTITAGVIVLLALCVILLSALMTLSIWRHENKYLDELIRAEEQDLMERPPEGMPIV
jgi:archaellum biogenesis protein FlaJ (TadC family)